MLGSADPALSLAEGVSGTIWGSSEFTVGGDTLVFSSIGSPQSQLQWRGRAGELRKSLGKQQVIYNINASPEFDRIATTPGLYGNPIGLLSGSTGNDLGLKFPLSYADLPVWSPDSRELIYMRAETELVRVQAGSLSPIQTLVQGTDPLQADDWSRDGRLLLYERWSRETGEDLWIRTMAEASGNGTPYLQTKANEAEGQFSPDGRWVAYTSDESGRYEVYVESLPRGRGRWRISGGGGSQRVGAGMGAGALLLRSNRAKADERRARRGRLLYPAPPVVLFPLSFNSSGRLGISARR